MRFISTFFLLLLATKILLGSVIIAGPADFRSYLINLETGDTLYLSPGNYTQSLRIVSISGTSQQPILISGQPGLAKPVFLGNSCCNTISITESSFLQIKDIICNGQNIVGIDALKAEGSSGNYTHDIEVEGLEIYNYGADQQNVGISTKCPSWNWWIHHNIIEAAGTGFYLGNSDGNQPFVNGIIEYNLITNTVGYNGQIKHQNLNTRDLSIGMPANASTVIRYNVFSKSSNASTGGAARPNLLVGNFPASGPGSTDYYDIYGNLFYQNPVEALFQGTGNIGFYNNILFNNMGGWGISIQSHNGFQPREIDLFFNTVLVDGSSGISVTGVNGSYSQRVWANAVFAGSPISGGSVDQNITADFNQTSNYLNGTSLPLSSLDLSPDGTALDISGIELSTFSKYTSPDFDFDGRQRSGEIAGAYAANSLIWPLQLMIRNQVELQDISTEAEIYLDQSSINIYPCPTDQFLQIEGLLSDYQINILDVNGNVFQTLNTSSSVLSVDLAGLPAGIFFISIFSNSHANLSMIKMIKMSSF